MIKHEVISSTKRMCTMLGFESGEATYPLKSFKDGGITEFEQDLKELGWPFAEN